MPINDINKTNPDAIGETNAALALFDGAIVSPWLQHLAISKYVNLEQVNINFPYIDYGDSKFMFGKYQNVYVGSPVEYRYLSYYDNEGDVVRLRIPVYPRLEFDAEGNSSILKPNGEPVLTSDQFEILKNQERLAENKITEHQEVSSERMEAIRAPNNALLGSLTGILGIFGIYQMSYSIAKNNAAFRNAYSKYVAEIHNLSEIEMQQIYAKHPADAKAQHSLVSNVALTKQLNNIYYDTLQSGVAVTLIFSLVLSFFIGPFALISTAVGFIISAIVAKYNYHILANTIDAFDEKEVNNQISKKIQNTAENNAQNPSEKNTLLNRILNVIAASSISMRIATIGQLGIALISVPILAVFELVKSVLRFYMMRKVLTMLFNNTEELLNIGLQVNTETLSLTSNRFSRNTFKKYLLSNLSRVEQIINDNDLKSTAHDSKFATFIRPVMSLFGIWENTRVNNALNALYASNHKSYTQLELLRRECVDLEISKKLEKHYKKYGNKTTLTELLNTDPEKYAEIMRAYLTQAASNQVKQIITNTGLANALSIAVIVGSTLLAFSPLGPYAFAVAAGAFSLVYVMAKVAAYYNGYKIQQKLSALDSVDFDLTIQASKGNILRANTALLQNITVPATPLKHTEMPVERIDSTTSASKTSTTIRSRSNSMLFQGPNKDIDTQLPVPSTAVESSFNNKLSSL